MTSTLNVVHKLEQMYVFKGLCTQAIKYVRRKGLWMPVTDAILEVTDNIRNKNCQIYVESPNHDNYLTFIIEHNEFLTGAVYNNVDDDAVDVEGFLHQYAMEDGSLMYEIVQAVYNGVLFLALADVRGELVIGWKNKDMEDILKL